MALFTIAFCFVSLCSAQFATPTGATPPPPPQRGLSGGAIAGIVIGVIAGTFAIVIFTCCYIRSKFRGGSFVQIGVGAPDVSVHYQQPADEQAYYIYSDAGAQPQEGVFEVNGVPVHISTGPQQPDPFRRANQSIADTNRRLAEEEQRRNRDRMHETHRRNMETVHRNNAQLQQSMNNMHQQIHRQQQQSMQMQQQSMQRMQQQQRQQAMYRPPMH